MDTRRNLFGATGWRPFAGSYLGQDLPPFEDPSAGDWQLDPDTGDVQCPSDETVEDPQVAPDPQPVPTEPSEQDPLIQEVAPAFPIVPVAIGVGVVGLLAVILG